VEIIHLVSVLSPDGAFGGPASVAVAQAKALQDAGHRVTIVAGWLGRGVTPPTEISGVQCRLFPIKSLVPGAGFSGLCAPGLHEWLFRNARRFDVLHLHAARDVITLVASVVCRARKLPYVAQPHGMIDVSRHPLAGILDLIFTRRMLRSAETVFHLTDLERADLESVAGNGLHLVGLKNGIETLPRETGRSASSPEVLFLARLHARKRPLLFLESAALLAPARPDVMFTIIGPDGGQMEQVKSVIATLGLPNVRLQPAVPPMEVISRMASAAVYVLPALNEPFGMTVIEAMAAETPVVISNTCDLAETVASTGSGYAVRDEPTDYANAIRSLLNDADLREAMGRNGASTVASRFGMKEVLDTLVHEYTNAIQGADHR
jgi:glycosyltransferase involved in cell wall biosynthesis